MTALAKDRKTDQLGTPDVVIPGINAFPMAVALIYAGALVAINSAGYLNKASADPTLTVVGIAERQLDNSAGSAGDLTMQTNLGVFYLDVSGTAPTRADVGKLMYVVDDHTVALDDGGGQRPPAGFIFAGPRADGQVPIAVAQPSLRALNPEAIPSAASGAFTARGVLTSVAAYAAAAGVITATATGAIGAQDGLTLVAGDLVLLPAGIAAAAADAGPYIVTSPGGTGVKFVLSRPDWWATGSGIGLGARIEVGGGGTNFAGTTWKALAVKGKVVDTDDPVLYPQHQKFTVTLASGTYTIGAGGGGENLFLRTGAVVQATQNTHAGTLGTNRLEAPSASRITGVAGTAAVVINSLIDAGTVQALDTSTVDVLVTNW